MNRNKVSILIPCLNEVETINQVINDAKKNARLYLENGFEIIVADNGSTDGTLEKLKNNKEIKVVKVPIKGYGAALHWGILNATGKFIVFADADMSYPFSNLKNFKSLVNQNPDIVLGSRYKGNIQKGAMPFLHRYLGTPVLTFLINIIYGTNISDCNSGMRMIKKDFYKKLNMTSSGMEWASELLLKSALVNGLYKEVPIKFIKDKRKKDPHLNTWADGWRHLKAIVLLKPESMYFILFVFAFLAVGFYFINFAFTFLFADLFIVFLLSLFTLDLLGSIINKKDTKISKFLIKFQLVPITGAITLIVSSLILTIPESRLGTKLFLISILGILFMWIFFVETIKTHLVHKLPNDENNK